MHELVEAIEKAEKLKELKEKLLECFKSEVNTKGFECMDVKEASEVVDMIKDLAETERNCMEALYYQKVIEAMTSYDEPRYGESVNMGYNRNRYKSSGRYAPSGMGTRMGFMPPNVPYLEYDGEMYPEDYMKEAMMGYSDGRGGSNTNRSSNSSNNQGQNNQSWNSNMGYNGMMMDPRRENEDPRYGKAYNEYKYRRRHYTETKSPEDKKEMDTHAEEHIRDTIATVRDIWGDADPILKKRMKEDFTKLLSEMNAG